MAKKQRPLIERLEHRYLLSASLSLGGSQSISPTPPEALDQAAPVGGHQAESMTAVDPTNPLNVATVVTKYGFTTLLYYSRDGGKTWNSRVINLYSSDDPCVAFDNPEKGSGTEKALCLRCDTVTGWDTSGNGAAHELSYLGISYRWLNASKGHQRLLLD